MTRAPAGAADLLDTVRIDTRFGDHAFDDRFPTQPIAVARHPVGHVLDRRPDRAPHAANTTPVYREPRPPRHQHAAPAAGSAHRAPARAARSTSLVAVAAVVAAVIGAAGYLWLPASSAAHDPHAAGPAAAAEQAEDARRQHAGAGDDRGAHAVGRADGVVPDGVTVFDDEFPAVTKLDPALLDALRRAAKDARRGGVTFYVNSGWRSPEYQNQLLREAVARYGSEEEAARWVATADTSRHVSGDAVDIGKSDAAAWLSENGAEYGLCQIYRNEPWHYELRRDAVEGGCPRMYADPTHDPRMQK